MSTLYPYRIHLSSILAARGNLSADLIDKILHQSTSYCESLDDDLTSQEGWMASKQILSDFLKGIPFDCGDNSAKHWYIVELLCNGLGKQLSHDKWAHANVDDFYIYDEFRMYFLGMDELVRIPSPIANPAVFTIENTNLEKAKLHIDKSSHSDEEKNQFIDWVQTALDNDQDLILFRY